MSTLNALMTKLVALEFGECLLSCREFERTYLDDYTQVLQALRGDVSQADRLLTAFRDVEQHLHALCRRFEIRSKTVQQLLTSRGITAEYRATIQSVFSDEWKQQVGREVCDSVAKLSNLHAACVARVMLLIPPLTDLLDDDAELLDDDSGDSDGVEQPPDVRALSTEDTANEVQLIGTDFGLNLDAEQDRAAKQKPPSTSKVFEVHPIGEVLVVELVQGDVRRRGLELQNALSGLRGQLHAEGIEHLVFDFGSVQTVSSLILGELAKLSRGVRERRGRVVACNMCAAVAHALNEMRLGRVWIQSGTLEQALQAARSGTTQ